LKPEYDALLSNFAFKFNMRRYTLDSGGGDVTLGTVKGAILRVATDGGAVSVGKLVGRAVNLHTAVRRCSSN
jgi:hypothetical protein